MTSFLALSAQSLARHRRIKEKYGQSEFKKMMNRTKFGVYPNFCAAIIEAQQSKVDDFFLALLQKHSLCNVFPTNMFN